VTGCGKKKKQIGDHALPQRGVGLGTPEGAEGGGAASGNTGPGRQRERAQATVQQTSSKHTFTSRHVRINNRSPNQKYIAGKNRADGGTNMFVRRAGTSGQEAERVEKPRHAKAVDIRTVKRVNMQCLAHPRGRDSVTRQDIQEIKPQSSRIRAIRRGSLAAQKEMLDAVPAAFHKGVPPSSIQRWPSDANLAIRTRTEPMQWQGVPRHRVTEKEDGPGGHKGTGTQAEQETAGAAPGGSAWKGSNGEG
jgi:hypothetical protein